MVPIFQMRKQRLGMRKRLAQNLPFLRGLLTLLSRVVASPISSGVCSCWVLGRCPPLPNPTKLCNTSPTEQPVATASRDLAAGNQGSSLPTPGPPAQHLTDGDPTHLSLRRDAASAGRASASLQAPTSVMLFWDKLQGGNEGEGSGPNLNAPTHQRSCPRLGQSWGPPLPHRVAQGSKRKTEQWVLNCVRGTEGKVDQ